MKCWKPLLLCFRSGRHFPLGENRHLIDSFPPTWHTPQGRYYPDQARITRLQGGHEPASRKRREFQKLRENASREYTRMQIILGRRTSFLSVHIYFRPQISTSSFHMRFWRERWERFERRTKGESFGAARKASGKRPQKIRMGENQWKR